jgi:phage terminase large subunit-like protein
VFDPERASRVCNFFTRVLGFELIRWQTEILRHIFGNVDERGLRIIARAYLEVAKKNGKSSFAAGLPLYMLLDDNEPGAECYSAATTKEQAGIVFRTAAAMVEGLPVLRRQLRVIRSTKVIVKRKEIDSYYKAISADGDAQDGINPHCAVIDELHRWRTARAFELYDVLVKGAIARRQPLAFEITTAGSTEEESPIAHQEHEYTENTNARIFTDAKFFGRIYAAKPDDDWTKEETWLKANPSLAIEGNPGGFLPLAAIKSKCEEAINMPSRQSAFKRYHLGIWLSTEKEWMPIETWDGCAAETRAVVDRPCYIGLDLSSTVDLTSLVLLFPDLADGSYDILPFFWMPKDRIRERELADRVPYGTWVEQGLIEAVEGDVIDQREIKKKIQWATECFDIRELGYDPHSARQLALELNDTLGVKCIPVPQVFAHLSEPTKKLMELALQKKLRHGGHAVLRWNAKCVRVKGDGNDNIKPVKPDRMKSGKRIDGIVALILAISRGMFHQGSIYDTQRIMTI